MLVTFYRDFVQPNSNLLLSILIPFIAFLCLNVTRFEFKFDVVKVFKKGSACTLRLGCNGVCLFFNFILYWITASTFIVLAAPTILTETNDLMAVSGFKLTMFSFAISVPIGLLDLSGIKKALSKES